MTNQMRVSRRHLLRVGGLGWAGLTLPALLEARESPRQIKAPRADQCILLFLNGGPSHLDMWDLKPHAPDGIRGEFQPIATSLPGYHLSEHLPQLARQMHRAAVVRSVHHGVNNSHASAVYTAMTGHDRGDAQTLVGKAPQDYPTPGAVLSKLRPSAGAVVPHVVLPYITKEGANGPPQPGFFGGFLGAAHDPLFVLNDPNAANFSVPELMLLTDVSLERLDRRQRLFAQFDAQFNAVRDTVPQAMTSYQQKALELLTSAATQRAFRLNEEPDRTRQAYGRNIYGQSVLLARRLVEAGTRMITISWAPDANATWDTHQGNFVKLKTTLLPQFDQACAALVNDLAERGLLERTVVVALGDFGRTPRVNKNQGRDHWNYCYSAMLLGGGIRGGVVYGSSDSTGAFPASDACLPGDLWATVYQALGIPADLLLHDALNRPHRLVAAGEPLPALLA